MLAKKYRLPSSFFKKIEKEKNRPQLITTNALFSAKIYFSQLKHGRFAAVAPGSIFKKSILRNRVRRNVYESIRLSKIYLKKNIDCVFYLKKQISEASDKMIESELIKTIK